MTEIKVVIPTVLADFDVLHAEDNGEQLVFVLEAKK